MGLVFCSAHKHIALHKSGPTAERAKMSIKSLVSWIGSWRRYRTAVSELDQLNDSELAELGLTRQDIENVARQSAGI